MALAAASEIGKLQLGKLHYFNVEEPNSVRQPSSMTMVLFVLGVWLCLALAVGISGRFESASAPLVAGTVWILDSARLVSLLESRSDQ